MEKRRRKTTQKNYLIMLCDGRGTFGAVQSSFLNSILHFHSGKLPEGGHQKWGERREVMARFLIPLTLSIYIWLSLPTGVITHCWDGNLQFNQINSRSQIPLLSTTIPQNSEREVSAGDR